MMPFPHKAHKAHKGHKVVENCTVFWFYRVLCGLCGGAVSCVRVKP